MQPCLRGKGMKSETLFPLLIFNFFHHLVQIINTFFLLFLQEEKKKQLNFSNRVENLHWRGLGTRL